MKQHATVKTAKTCDYCNGLIMDADYHLIDIDDKKSFSHPYDANTKKMCNRCWNKLSHRARSKITLAQIDAFPDYPTESFASA